MEQPQVIPIKPPDSVRTFDYVTLGHLHRPQTTDGSGRVRYAGSPIALNFSDPETLEVAIASLESLRQDHKTVGVISHVGLLKERIHTQIVVEKNVGGVSRIRVIPEETVA